MRSVYWKPNTEQEVKQRAELGKQIYIMLKTQSPSFKHAKKRYWQNLRSNIYRYVDKLTDMPKDMLDLFIAKHESREEAERQFKMKQEQMAATRRRKAMSEEQAAQLKAERAAAKAARKAKKKQACLLALSQPSGGAGGGHV